MALSVDLHDQVAVVLGAGTGADGIGNGAAIAITYARAGAQVIVGDLDETAAARTVELITREHNAATPMRVDVTRAGSIADLAESVLATRGRVDILHNNVGVVRMGGPTELSEADWRLVMDTSLTGVFLACKAFLPAMIIAGAGCIVNTSSIAAVKHTGLNYSAYYAAKAGLNHLTSTLAVQHARDGIRVNAIMPGMIDTPLIYRDISRSYPTVQDMVEARNNAVPMGRMGTVWEVSQAALFLASNAAAYITGVCLAVDGGLSAQ